MAHEALTALVGPREVASAQGATTAALRSLLEGGRLDQSGLTVAEVSAVKASCAIATRAASRVSGAALGAFSRTNGASTAGAPVGARGQAQPRRHRDGQPPDRQHQHMDRGQ